MSSRPHKKFSDPAAKLSKTARPPTKAASAEPAWPPGAPRRWTSSTRLSVGTGRTSGRLPPTSRGSRAGTAWSSTTPGRTCAAKKARASRPSSTSHRRSWIRVFLSRKRLLAFVPSHFFSFNIFCFWVGIFFKGCLNLHFFLI